MWPDGVNWIHVGQDVGCYGGGGRGRGGVGSWGGGIEPSVYIQLQEYFA